MGVDQEAIRNIEEGGVQQINSEMLIAMAEVLNVKVDYFYRRPAPEKNSSFDRLERLVEYALSKGIITSSKAAGLLNVSVRDVGRR